MRTQSRPSKANVSPTSGKPYEYQSLEELLQANGYKETRIFTPDSDRLNAAKDSAHEESPTRARKLPGLPTEISVPGSTSSAAGGGVVASLLSSLIPGGPRSTPRMEAVDPEPKQPVNHSEGKMPMSRGSPLLPSPDLGVEQPTGTAGRSQRGKQVPRTALTDALESALRKAQQPQHTGSQASAHSHVAPRLLHRKSRGASPASTLTPSSSSSTIRPSSRQRLHQQTHGAQVTHEETRIAGSRSNLAPPTGLRLPLRHHASAPAVGRSKSTPAQSTVTVRAHRKPLVNKGETLNPPEQESWLGTFSRVFSHVGAISRDNLAIEAQSPVSQPPGLQRSLSSTSRKSRVRNRPELMVTQHFSPAPATATVSTLRSDAVLCRSAPASRSTSRVRGRDTVRRGKSPQDSSKNGKGHLETPLLSPSLESGSSDPISSIWIEDLNRTDDVQSSTTEDDEDTDPPNLQDLLSSHLKRHAHRAGSNRNSYISTSESDSDEPVTRRQRSIRSLRAHLNNAPPNVAIPGVNGVPALPSLPFIFNAKPSAARCSAGQAGAPSQTFEAWLNGDEGHIAKEQLHKQKKRGLLPQWLSPKDASSAQLSGPSASLED